MSGREWKPGELAMVNDTTGGPEHVAVCTRGGVTGDARWNYGKGDVWSSVSEARPLVVIDPEDRGEIERFARVYSGQASGVFVCDLADDLQNALREFANPTPPKPEEPTGLGAVVEDSAGVEWVRTERRPNLTGTVWTSAFHVTKADRAEMREYVDIKAVRVLSEGVTQ